MEQANQYLEQEFLPWWNQHLVVAPANPTDAHRQLGPEHDLASALSRVETRQVNNDYTIQLEGKLYQIERSSIRAGLRGAVVRVERRLDGSLAVRFGQHGLHVVECEARPKPGARAPSKPKPIRSPKPASPGPAILAVMNHLLDKPGLPV